MTLVAIVNGSPLDDLPPFENERTAAEADISECKIVQALVVALAPALQHGVLPCQKGFSVGFTAAAALVHELLEVRDEKGSCASSASSPATSCSS